MSILVIRTYPDEILRRTASPIEAADDPALARLIDDMIETMHDARGVGLAAPQIGVSRRLCVIDTSGGEDPEAILAMINPEILSAEGEDVAEEGCLSIPGYHDDVKRAARLTVRFLDRTGAPWEIEADGLLARAVQHELDHLNGVLFIDRLGMIRKELFKRKFRKAMAGS